MVPDERQGRQLTEFHAQLQAYGKFLGQRYANFDNIIWMFGNDYLASSAGNADMAAVIQGIKQFDNIHLITMQMDAAVGFPPAAFDNPTLPPVLTVNGIYLYDAGPYRDTYLGQYNRSDFGPTFNIETSYEKQFGYRRHSVATVRAEHYAFLLDGAIGDLYGNERVGGAFSGGPFASGLENAVKLPGDREMIYFANLLNSVAWPNLVPDRMARSSRGSAHRRTIPALVTDGTLAIAYKPGSGQQCPELHSGHEQVLRPRNRPVVRSDQRNLYHASAPGLANRDTHLYRAEHRSRRTKRLRARAARRAHRAATPTGLTATSANAQVALTWTASSRATSYNIYRATSSGGEGTTPYRTDITTTSFTDTGLTNGTTYYYQVSAVNTVGESSMSGEISATPGAGNSGPDTTAPTVALTGPANGATVSGTMMIFRRRPTTTSA